MQKHLICVLPVLLCLCSQASAARPDARSQSHEVVRIWPGQAPGTEDWKAPEEAADVTLPSVGKIHVITNVTVPTLTIFRPAAGKVNGTAMVVLPGGSRARVGRRRDRDGAMARQQRDYGLYPQISGEAAREGRILRGVAR